MTIVYSSQDEEQEPDEDCRGCPLPEHLPECYFASEREAEDANDRFHAWGDEE
jgi:hypothetical protein